MIGLRRELQGLCAFGTDGEKPLADAFTHEFRYAVRLTCFIHCRRNIKMKLQELHYPQSAVDLFLQDVFGRQDGTVLCEGLVDSEYDDFDSKVEMLGGKWLKQEEEYGALPGFSLWFLKNKATVIKRTMLKSYRVEAGLGLDPPHFTTNPSETTNAIIKAHVSYKNNQLFDFVNHWKDVVDEQEAEVERAVIRRGKFQFAEEYKYKKGNGLE